MKLDLTIDKSKQRMVLSEPHIGAGVPLGAALARNNIACQHLLAAENLQTQPLTVGVPALAGGPACFLVSHGSSSLFVRYVIERRRKLTSRRFAPGIRLARSP